MPRLRGGYRPSGYDGRDINWNSSGRTLSQIMLGKPPVKKQGNEVDSCTAMSVTTAMEILDGQDGYFHQLSPLFNYYYSRRDPRHLGPVFLRNALSSAGHIGICSLGNHNMPNTPAGALSIPNSVAVDDAKSHKLVLYDSRTGISGYYGLDGSTRLMNWKNALSQGRPIVAGIYTQSSYWAQEGMLVNEHDVHQGAHAVTVIGFNDETRSFIVLDSRGVDFADNGLWRLSYEVVESPRIIESWTVTTITYNYQG